MKKILSKYYGAILLYSVIVFGILALNARFAYLNQQEIEIERESFALVGE